MELFIRYDSGKFYDKSSSGRRKPLTDDDILQLLLAKDDNLTMKQAKAEVEELKNMAQKAAYTSKDEDDPEHLVEQAILTKEPLKDFFIVQVLAGTNSVYYKGKDNIIYVSTLASFSDKILKGVLCDYAPELLSDLLQTLSTLIHKKRTVVTVEDVCQRIINVCQPHVTLKRIFLDDEPHPIGVEGFTDFALSVIPFKQCDVTFTDLSKSMQSFLSRTEHHEYLCAIIWSHLMGNHLPYVIYMRGFGGDGKTGFLRFIGWLTKSYASFAAGAGFDYYSMYGKAVITIEENESSHLMQNRTLKSITGGNFVKIEGKNKDAFTGVIKGLIFVDSNYDLECANTDDEKRRLRFFRVSPIDRTATIEMTLSAYLKDLRSTSNEFLNYCRQCFDTLEIKGSGGLIKKSPNHDAVFESMRDVVQDNAFAEFFSKKIAPAYDLISESSADASNILIELNKIFSKDKFAAKNFKRWLYSTYGILTDGKYFIGLKEKESQSIDDFMPKD